ncbi:peptidoglycan-binding protein [Cellulomonas cellasea]|uniref:peptidoglycan-binding protein n=1 Tax=Cellulomonas cellasea TaxID=43670 RepID=UPI0025A46A36|nr:peptidoglycan-binding protein [Cellulomonas cellasea]MDM8084969.1 peptidoglycan-binding protein [Cellulomonas cellasea]
MSRAVPTHARSARSRTAAWLTAAALVAMAAAVVAVALLSPAMRSEPAKREPEATPVTRAVVERRALGGEAPTLQGTLRATTTISVNAPALTPPVARLVVTDAPAGVGTIVSSGNVLIGISGRPIIALATDVPLYRPLYPEDTGEDVRQLQAALGGLGLYTGEVDGVFGPLTAAAITAMYAQVGYAEPAPEAPRVAALEQAEDRWAALVAAEEAAEEDGTGGPSARDREQARRELTRARDDAGTWLPLDEVAHVPASGALVTSITELGSVLAPDETTVAVLIGGQPIFTVRAQAGQHAVFTAGDRVEVRALDGSAAMSGTVQHAAAATGAAADRASEPASGAAGSDEIVIAAPQGSQPGIADGAQVIVTLEGRVAREEALVVPEGAVREDEDGQYVLVPTAGGEARRLDVDIGARRDGYVEVLPGAALREGDEVLLGGGDAHAGTG